MRSKSDTLIVFSFKLGDSAVLNVAKVKDAYQYRPVLGFFWTRIIVKEENIST